MEIRVGPERVVGDVAAARFGVEAGAAVAVSFEPPGAVTVHVYGREIGDGDLTCSLGPRRAAVVLDVGFAARIVAEALRRGMALPEAEAQALRAALAVAPEAETLPKG